MEYFRSGLKSVLGTTTPGNQPTGAEIVSVAKLIKICFVNKTFFRWRDWLAELVRRLY